MTKIEWTTHTWNPTTGCVEISPGCKHCYARTMHERQRAMAAENGRPKYAHPWHEVRVDEASLEKPVMMRRPARIFVNSMSDLLHKQVPLDFIMRVFTVMVDKAPHHEYQVLTKRADRWPEVHAAVVARWGRWPSHVLPGVSIESAAYLGRLAPLAEVGDENTVRMVSAEPLLGSLAPIGVVALGADLKHHRVGWVIAGGESGHEARPCELSWLRDIRDACTEAAVPFFLKQLGGPAAGKEGKRGGELAVLDGERHQAFPVVRR